ncbi:MAG: Mini-ribonuclease 3 [Leptolyngbya sp. SIO1D8]|nr:Mini-ribonuclease 3 [Leptolyngbya sp. SIO1D8]
MSQSPSDCQHAEWLASFTALFPEKSAAMVLSDTQLRSLSPLALAYIGDAVYELFVRGAYLLPSKRIQTYHRLVVGQVRAEQQACHLEFLKPYLTEAEQDVIRRGRNAAPKRGQRASVSDYQKATALEALMGYLYLTDPKRLIEILSYLPLEEEEAP